MAIACKRVKVQKEKRMCVNIPIRDLSISFHFVLQIRYEDNVVAQQQQQQQTNVPYTRINERNHQIIRLIWRFVVAVISIWLGFSPFNYESRI